MNNCFNILINEHLPICCVYNISKNRIYLVISSIKYTPALDLGRTLSVVGFRLNNISVYKNFNIS